MFVERSVSISSADIRIRFDDEQKRFRRIFQRFDAIPDAGPSRGTAIEKERHISAEPRRQFIELLPVRAQFPQSGQTNQRSGRIRRPTSQTSVTRNSLFQTNARALLCVDPIA